jgi:hypothetical protein
MDDDTDEWMFNLTISLMTKQAVVSTPKLGPNIGPYRTRFLDLTEAITGGLIVSDSVVSCAYAAYATACVDYFNTVDKIKAIEENSESLVYGYETQGNKKEAAKKDEDEDEDDAYAAAAAMQPRGDSESADEFTGENMSVVDNARDTIDSVECATHG